MTKVQLDPVGWMSQLSQLEVSLLQQSTKSDLYGTFRNCCLAVLNSGVEEDNYHNLFAPYSDFDVRLLRRERGVKIELINPPEVAFVDGKLIKGVHEHLFAVVRDMLYMGTKDGNNYEGLIDAPSALTTHVVFDMLRHADAISQDNDVNMIVCWGGHSIREEEYKYTKLVGYELGLRGFNICTGCGPGAMKGPMKGATIGHAKQRNKKGRYLGISEPSIIAAEPPNAIVNELIIMPDIEKRLEAFVRISHGIVIFPGGAGTAEELLYLLGLLMDEENKEQIIPLILTGPENSKAYFEAIDQFIGETLGAQAQAKYTIVVGDAAKVGTLMAKQKAVVEDHRRDTGNSLNFNWTLKISEDFQNPFMPTHKNMSSLNLKLDQPKAALAATLRKCFSGIVAGNVKVEGIKEIKQHGPFELTGDVELMQKMDVLLNSFVDQGRMKLPGSHYEPCYKITL
jgi:predicted Rossmann-fold nucleotide-binding protein